ncbi:hypothetical protein DDD_1989 [Nonlabens dokdonensis DSW-6]|uniref:Uncharacterized protein n=1 Tax=Nonlabens dokdonensis (strain DSM 17205 / KCTC 12402 / DSW-6) TaxID=592029 RepID=L7WB47_NONDD|nr:hypothetical protein DDD_1989 [Nonlabens dokdonensis DSW-6]
MSKNTRVKAPCLARRGQIDLAAPAAMQSGVVGCGVLKNL